MTLSRRRMSLVRQRLRRARWAAALAGSAVALWLAGIWAGPGIAVPLVLIASGAFLPWLLLDLACKLHRRRENTWAGPQALTLKDTGQPKLVVPVGRGGTVQRRNGRELAGSIVRRQQVRAKIEAEV